MIKGTIFSEEHKNKLRLLRLGTHHSTKTKLKMRMASLGKHKSAEHAKHIREGLKKLGIIPWNKGKHHTKEEIQKIYATRIGKVKSKETKLKISKTLIGHSVSPETRYKMSIHHNPLLRGETHWNWQGGKSFEPYPLGWTKTFKEQIRQRDGYKCQMCGCSETDRSKLLSVHHIDYNKHNLNPNNLISLCTSCHITLHHKDNGQEYFNNSNTTKEVA